MEDRESHALLAGKTLLAKTLANVLDVPFSVSDATTFTQVSTLNLFPSSKRVLRPDTRQDVGLIVIPP